MALRILGVAPKVDEKGVALKVCEEVASHTVETKFRLRRNITPQI